MRIDRVTSKPLLLACCAGLALFLVSCADAARSPTQPSHPAADAPATPPPVAKLDVHGEIPGTSAIYEGWETTFDASRSTGDLVSFVIAYGDGASGDAAVTHHALARHGPMTATATVTDRYGRTDTATTSSYVYTLAPGGSGWYIGVGRDGDFSGPWLVFMEQHGTQVSGAYSDAAGPFSVFPDTHISFAGTLNGTNGLRIRLDDGSTEFTGTMSSERRAHEKIPDWLSLVARGGALDGASIEFNYYDPY